MIRTRDKIYGERNHENTVLLEDNVEELTDGVLILSGTNFTTKVKPFILEVNRNSLLEIGAYGQVTAIPLNVSNGVIALDHNGKVVILDRSRIKYK